MRHWSKFIVENYSITEYPVTDTRDVRELCEVCELCEGDIEAKPRLGHLSCPVMSEGAEHNLEIRSHPNRARQGIWIKNGVVSSKCNREGCERVEKRESLEISGLVAQLRRRLLTEGCHRESVRPLLTAIGKVIAVEGTVYISDEERRLP
ncbi:hypothetical protein BR93DRAFT_607158 [Coniochaeta sp. PMI_546]|nr:hypothetical protein BR93DRAFT_607158 [Coniochaeta sp. PMI_546]